MAVMAIFRLLRFERFESVRDLRQRLADGCQFCSQGGVFFLQGGFFGLPDQFLLSHVDQFFFCCHGTTLSALAGFGKPSRTPE